MVREYSSYIAAVRAAGRVSFMVLAAAAAGVRGMGVRCGWGGGSGLAPARA